MKKKLIDANVLCDTLHGIGGCDAEKESWAAGWDSAITAAIELVGRAPTIDAESVNRERSKGCEYCKKERKPIDWEFCPMCGKKLKGETNE